MHCDCGDKSEYFDFEVWQKKSQCKQKNIFAKKPKRSRMNQQNHELIGFYWLQTQIYSDFIYFVHLFFASFLASCD